MTTGKTKTGFKFTADERILNDWRFISAISDADSEDVNRSLNGTTTLIRLLFGENEKALVEHVQKKNDGFVPMDAITAELVDIISSMRESKN